MKVLQWRGPPRSSAATAGLRAWQQPRQLCTKRRNTTLVALWICHRRLVSALNPRDASSLPPSRFSDWARDACGVVRRHQPAHSRSSDFSAPCADRGSPSCSFSVWPGLWLPLRSPFCSSCCSTTRSSEKVRRLRRGLWDDVCVLCVLGQTPAVRWMKLLQAWIRVEQKVEEVKHLFLALWPVWAAHETDRCLKTALWFSGKTTREKTLQPLKRCHRIMSKIKYAIKNLVLLRAYTYSPTKPKLSRLFY